MRRSGVSVSLALLILALLVGGGLWLRHRGGRERLADERSTGAATPAGKSGSPGTALVSDAPPPGPTSQAAEPELAEEASSPAAGAEPPVAIAGRVTDALGDGVGDARVVSVERKAVLDAIEKDAQLLNDRPLEALRAFQVSLADLGRRLPSCRTSADGAYALRGLPAGEHRIVVAHPDFLTHREEDWILVEAGVTARYDVELAPGQAISGLVRDPEGGPIAGARVEATPVEKARLRGFGQLAQLYIDQHDGAFLLAANAAETDAEGAFRLTSLAPGLYDLRLVKEGHAWGEIRGVAAGTEGVSVTLVPAIRIDGRVVSPGGEAVAGARIVLRTPAPDLDGPAGPLALAFADVDLFGEKEGTAESGEDGGFTVAACAAGSYDLVIRARGFPELRRAVAVERRPLALGDLVLAEGLEIAGAVQSPDGPVEGAEVWVPEPAARKEDREARRASVLDAGPSSGQARSRTDRRGAFRLAGLAAGVHEVAVLAAGYPGDLLEKVTAGSRNVAITLQRGLTIAGTVVDAESRAPLPGARVRREGGAAGEEAADAEGRFELRGLSLDGGQASGGSVAIRLVRDGYRETRAVAAFPDPAAAPVAVLEVEMRRLEAEERDGSISGVVLDDRGEPSAGARVWTEVPGWPRVLRGMEPPGGLPKEARTAADGTFTVRVPVIGGSNFEVLAARPGLATSRAGPFPQNPEGGSWPFVEIRLGEGAALEGRVTGADGGPLAGARVRIWRDAQVPEEGTLFTQLLPESVGQTTYSTGDGSFRLRRIEPGNYRVEARASGHAARTIGPVAIGAPQARVDLALEAGGRLAGRVVDHGGTPLPGIEVVASPLGDGGPASGEDDDLIRTGMLGAAAAVTGADGTYALEHLAAGEFRLLARARGREPAAIPASVPGPPLPDIVLAPHARIAGRAREAATSAPVVRFGVRLDRRDVDGLFREDPRQAREIGDAGGRFASEGLRAGEWRVRVSAAGFAPWSKVLSLAPGEEVELDAALNAGRRIEGTVTRPDGEPIAGAAIRARLAAGGREGEPRDLDPVGTGADGWFVVAGLEAGSYELEAMHPEHYGEPSEAVARVEVSAAEDAAVNLVLRPAGRIAGRVRGLSFRVPGSDDWVVAFSPVAPESRDGAGRSRGEEGAPVSARPFEVRLDEDGILAQDSIRPARYRLELIHRRNGPDTGGEWITVPPEARPLGEVDVRAGELATFEGRAQ
jgi:protocatechuate 3,4-dioxygenase beta subunit